MLLGSRLEVVCQTPGDPDPDVWIETIIKAVLFLDGAEWLTNGFLPSHVAARLQEGEAIELYEDSPKRLMKQNKSKRNHGKASYILLANILE